MERPQYVNAFTLSFNHVLNEVVINFTHEYPVLEKTNSSDPQSLSEDVCSVVLPAEIMKQLHNVIGNVLQNNPGTANG